MSEPSPRIPAGSDYIEHSIKTVASIKPEVLAQIELGALIGRSSDEIGKATKTYVLGEHLTPNGILHIAFKDVEYAEGRLVEELRDSRIISQRAPELVQKIPYFLGRIMVDGAKDISGLITEDASRGGLVIPKPIKTSSETLVKLDASFSDVGGLYVFDEVATEEKLAFDVDGEERLLDLYHCLLGSFLPNEAVEEYMQSAINAHKALPGVTIVIPPETPLAHSMLEIQYY